MTVSINGVYSPTFKNGVLVKETLSPANDTVNRGYYAATTLSAVDTDLATGNIKNGITIFGKVGSTNVRDTTDANALVGDVKSPKTFYAGGGAKKTGTMATRTLNAANDTVLAGYYAATTLSAVDVHLAAANIKSGVNIFGFVGVATVQDIADANAVLGGVKAGQTFYSVTGARKTGTMPTVALAAGSSAYPAGYHAGDGGGLPAIDGDLVTANIKNGITIFNVAGHVNVRDVSDANALVSEVKTGRTFYAVGGAIKTGNMPTVAITAVNDDYPAGYHAGNVGGLAAIDVNLAAANIKKDTIIFGKTGTFESTLVHDAENFTGGLGTTTDETVKYSTQATSTTPVLRRSFNLVVTAGACIEAYCCGYVKASAADREKIELYIGGVEVAESSFISAAAFLNKQVIGNKDGCSGSTAIEMKYVRSIGSGWVQYILENLHAGSVTT